MESTTLLPNAHMYMTQHGGYSWFGPMELAYYGVQLLHAALVILYFAAATVLGLDGGDATARFTAWSGSTPFSYAMLGLAIATSTVRALTCQFSFVALLANASYLRALAARARLGLRFIGSVDPAIDLSFMLQLASYSGVLILEGSTAAAVPALCAVALACADFLSFRLRFTQGRAEFKDSWSRCPLIDLQRKVFIAETKPGHLFALSYRWSLENAKGFSDENVGALLRAAAAAKLTGGFVDNECKWDDGSMATLDVNRNIYTTAEKHFIFADRAAFSAFLFRMRWKFFSFSAVLGAWLFVTLHFLPWTVQTLLVLFFFFAFFLNHISLYVTWGIQAALPGLFRVWLRLEYECRRDCGIASQLFDVNGVYQSVNLCSQSWVGGLHAMVWLFTGLGTPTCILPSPFDFSGLESRSASETLRLIDSWTGFSPTNAEARACWSSQMLCHPTETDTSAPGSVASVESHLVGGEIAYWFAGRLYKFDGFRGKRSNWYGKNKKALLCASDGRVGGLETTIGAELDRGGDPSSPQLPRLF